MGLLNVGQTTQDVKRRIEEQTKTAGFAVTIEIDEPAELDDGSFLTDYRVRD